VVLVELPSWMGLRVWGCRRWCACMYGPAEPLDIICGFCPTNAPRVGVTLKVLWHAGVSLQHRAISNILARLTQACLRAASNILARLTQTSCEQSACLRAVSNTSARQTQTSCEQSQACLRAVSNILASRAALSLACLDSTSSCSAVQVISTFSPRFVMHFSLVDSQPINKS
jgi:hypothetical protein